MPDLEQTLDAILDTMTTTQLRGHMGKVKRKIASRPHAVSRSDVHVLQVNDNAGGKRPSNCMTAAINRVAKIVGHLLNPGDAVVLDLIYPDDHNRVIIGVVMKSRVHFKGGAGLGDRGDSSLALRAGDAALTKAERGYTIKVRRR